MEGDDDLILLISESYRFLSTPSGWRATRFYSRDFHWQLDFYPRPPGGGRHEGSENEQIEYLFLSTPSGWRATPLIRVQPVVYRISIHALRVEGDGCTRKDVAVFEHFYPRPPGGGRPDKRRPRCLSAAFLSTPSGWRATEIDYVLNCMQRISIHALRVEGDSATALGAARLPNFYPRPPGGGRLLVRKPVAVRVGFLSTPSGWRATANLVISPLSKLSFLSTPSGWRATAGAYPYCKGCKFLSTPSGWRATQLP